VALQNETRPPLIGALLRLPWEVVHRRLLDELHAAGFTDLTVSHLTVMLYPAFEGQRPSDIAAQRGMSRQAINYILGQVEQLGYVERRGDRDDLRSKRIVLTPRGRKAGIVMRETVTEIEREWSGKLGSKRFAELKRLLADLGALVVPASGAER
jgi:DNA-binding MarR family transcriptional regulator